MTVTFAVLPATSNKFSPTTKKEGDFLFVINIINITNKIKNKNKITN